MDERSCRPASAAITAPIAATTPTTASGLSPVLTRPQIPAASAAIRCAACASRAGAWFSSRRHARPVKVRSIARSPGSALRRSSQLANDLADRLFINPERPPDPTNRFHCHHPRPHSPKNNQGELLMIRGAGRYLPLTTPTAGSLFHAEFQWGLSERPLGVRAEKDDARNIITYYSRSIE